MRDDPYPRYAYDDDLIDATRRDRRKRLRVYRLTDTVVVLGAGSRPAAELDLDACAADGVPVLRRRGGGCAVVLDPGNVIVSVAVTGMPFGHHRRHFDALTGWLAHGLAAIGVPGVRQAGICDLALGEHKVGGACLHRQRDLLYYSASLLFAADLARIQRYLRHPPREPDYRRGRAHAAFLKRLGSASGDVGEAERAALRLRQVLIPPALNGVALP